jgi:hypothetical protein
MVRTSERPVVGDVNRGAAGIGPLKELVKATRKLRVEPASLLFGDSDFPDRWLTRLD